MEQGKLFVISAPSGVGKTTLCRRLLDRISGLSFSVSYTTRDPRQGEFDGIDYHFISQDRFEEMISADAFLEWARVYGNFYGTGKSEVLSRLELGEDVLLDIDIQGARQIRRLFPEAVLIFLLPPSWSVLEARLRDRGSEDSSRLKLRMANAKSELEAVHEFDFVVVNDDLSRATEDLKSIVIAQRCITPRVLARHGLIQALKSW
ncbi:MAG: guanylate kinase [Deltaproteobacteria bacterium]|nr:MAG: guanylate kinase [Deltaproteobacteria bacterium]RKX57565.1 MAG: guanylate kinase [Thermodesulfobacteriota bacterium]